MTTDETRSNTGNLPVVMATTPDDDVTQTTGGTSPAVSSTSRDVEFYFQCAVVVIGVIGIVANGVILYALVASKQHKKKALIFNQNALDFFSSICLVMTYSVKLSSVDLSGLTRYWQCILVDSELFLYVGITGSKINLAAVTIERYLIVVHSKCTKKWLGKWVIWSVIMFTWVCAAVCMAAFIANGVCSMTFRAAAAIAGNLWYSVSFYVIILVIIIYCYGRIIVAIRRQSRVMAGHNQASETNSNVAQNQTEKRIKTNVIKTLIIVSVFFALFNLPNEVAFLAISFTELSVSMNDYSYFGTVFLVFLYICMNPFIYAIKFDPVKRVLLDLIPCKKGSEQVVESIALPRIGASNTISSR